MDRHVETEAEHAYVRRYLTDKYGKTPAAGTVDNLVCVPVGTGADDLVTDGEFNQALAADRWQVDTSSRASDTPRARVAAYLGRVAEEATQYSCVPEAWDGTTSGAFVDGISIVPADQAAPSGLPLPGKLAVNVAAGAKLNTLLLSVALATLTPPDAPRAARFANPPGECRILPIRHGYPLEPKANILELHRLRDAGFGGFAGTTARGR